MSDFFKCQLTQIEKNKLYSVFETKTIYVSGCLIWTGQQKKGYGVYETRFRGKKIKMFAHRLSYFIHDNFNLMDHKLNVSHVCHNELCVRKDHLSLEPQSINNRRKICKNNAECLLHYGYPKCLL